MQSQTSFRLGFFILLVLWSFVVVPKTYAQNIKAKYQYAVKFVCGPGDEVQAVRGFYLTAINVHNPGVGPNDVVTFAKKVVIALPKEEQGPVSQFRKESLRPNHALEIECEDIRSFFTIQLPGFIKGFVVILSPKPLDVVAVYTARSSNGEVEGIDVENIPARRVKVMVDP
jgi:hypothetical protein